MDSAVSASDRTAPAAAAAAGAARALGLDVGDPVIVHDVFSVVVHLAPSPVVARVPTVLPEPHASDLDGLTRRMRAELDLASWLDGQDCPVVPPSPLVPVEPVVRDGFAMTFWRYVDVAAGAEPDHTEAAGAVAFLHAAMRGYPGELPFLSSVDASIPASLALLDGRPDLLPADDLDRARREWAALAPVLTDRGAFGAAFPGASIQPIHGDSPAYNIIGTTTGELWADFEMATLGPAEWDLTLAGLRERAAYDRNAEHLGLRPLDPVLLAVMDAARMLQVVACCALIPRLPMLAEGLAAPLEQWRTTPFAGGFA